MVAELSKLEVIAVDCEGVNLSREGELCLVQIGTESKVYLVDVLEHGRALFEEGGLRALLESAKVRKVLHDCRYGRRSPPPGPTGASVNSPLLAWGVVPAESAEETVMRCTISTVWRCRTCLTHRSPTP